MFKEQKINFFDLVIFGSYFLVIYLAALSAFGFFNLFTVWPAAIVLAGIFLFLKNRICWPKKFWLILLLTIVVAGGLAFLRGMYSGDAYDRWLPVGREIVKTGFYPTESFQEKYGNVSPTLSLLIALTFIVANSFNSALCIWIPFLFTTLTIILILKWLREKEVDKKYLFWVPIIFLANSMVQSVGAWNLMTESILLFFSTAFFYYYERYSKEPKNLYLALIFFSFSLAFLTKIFVGIALLLFPLLLFKSKSKLKFIWLSFLFLTPLFIWYLRNYFLFDNPFFFIVNNLFVGKYSPYINKMSNLLLTPAGYESVWSRYKYVVYGIFNSYPIIFLAIYGWLKNKKIHYLLLFLSYFILKETLFFSHDSSVRYYYLFFGLMLVYAILALSQLRSKLVISIFIFLALWSLLLVPFWQSTSDFIGGLENKLEFLKTVLLWLSNHLLLLLLLLLPFIFLASRKKDIKIFLIFLYCLNILHLEFIYNKSWAISWTFIGLAILLFIIYSFKKIQLNLKIVSLIIVFLTLLVNPWLMSGIYYYRHGLSFPPAYTYQAGKWSTKILDELVPENKRSATWLLVDDLPDYYHWFANYPVAVYNYFDFWYLVDLKYNDKMSAEELHRVLAESGVSYIVRTTTEHKEHFAFFDKMKWPGFSLIENFKDRYFLWEVN